MLFLALLCCYTWERISANSISTYEKSTSLSLLDGYHFLSQFGYIIPSKLNRTATNALHKSSEMQRAIEVFQRSFKLKVTGKLDGATQRLMSSPRCGNKDSVKSRRFKRFSFDGKSKWNKKNLLYGLNSYPTSGLSRRKVHGIFLKAFNIWSKVADLNFDESNKKADIVISFGKRYHGDSIPFDGRGKVLAHAYFPTFEEVGYSRSGDAHFDDDENWTNRMTNGKHLLAVAVHELGHSLGLSHSLVKSAVMFPFYRPPQSGNVQLDKDDVSGIQSIYGHGDPLKVLKEVEMLPEDFFTQPLPTSRPISPDDLAPDICKTDINTVALIRGGQLYIFKDEWCWIVKSSKLINDWHSYELQYSPFKYTKFWKFPVKNGIDAMFERKKDQMIYIFKGKTFWMMKDTSNFGEHFDKNGRPLTNLGLPSSTKRVDTIFSWGFNNAVYIFSGHNYWRFDPKEGLYGRVKSTPKYPRSIRDVWRGLPTPIDAAYTSMNKQTYFIKGQQYYAFNNIQMRVQLGFPRQTSLPWLGCTKGEFKYQSNADKINAKMVKTSILAYLFISVII